MTTHTFKTLIRRIKNAGFDSPFIHSAILPEWWNEGCRSESALLPEIEIRIARFLGIPLTVVNNPNIPLTVPRYEGAHLRQVRDIDSDRLAPAIHAALRVGSAVVRNLRNPISPTVLPPNGFSWREQLLQEGGPVTLEMLLNDLWTRGIPIIPLDILPSPSFQGIACIVDGRPVVLLGHRHDEPGRVVFIVAHEAGHIANNDCSPNHPVVDEGEEIVDEGDQERSADTFATNVIVGDSTVPEIYGSNYRVLASNAWEAEQRIGVDAGHIIFTWASRTHDYTKATMAVKALYRNSGARQILRRYFNQNVNFDGASESDRALLRCVSGDSV